MLGFRPLCSGPLSEIRDAQAKVTNTTTMRFASRTFVTRATDAPANEPISGQIAGGLRVQRHLEKVEGGQFGALVETVYSEIALNNSDGSLDSLATQYAADGRQIRVKIGSTEFLPVLSRLIMWHANHEGSLTEWGNGSGPSGGGFFNSGVASVVASTEQARSGQWSMKATIDTNGPTLSAVRAARWTETFTSRDLYYSWWTYIDQHAVVVGGAHGVFWHIMGFKSELYDANGVKTNSDPILSLGVHNVGAALRIRIPYQANFFGGSFQFFTQSLADLPVQQWVHFEVFLHQAEDATGIFKVWQDDVELFNINGIQTKYAGGFQTWQLENYSDGLTPSVSTIYFDDVVIAYESVQEIERVQPYQRFATVYVSNAGSWNFDHDALRLRVESLNNRIQDRLQTEAYSGLGSIDGTAEIAGRSKPALFGRCNNVTPQLLDPAILTYQLHAGNIELVSAVYDGGAGGAHDTTVDFTFAGDFPTYAALAAASVPAGAYATSLAVGCLRLGVAPLFGVTVDARGHKDNITGNYIETTADIIRTILRDYAGISTSLIDHTAFNALNGLQPGDIGLFLPAGDRSTVTEVIRRLALGAGAFISDKSGFFNIQRLDPPSATLVHWAFTDRDIIGIERRDLPYLIPWKSWGVGYDVNWTVQTNSDLANSVTQTRRGYLQSERRYAYVQSVNIALFHATSHGAPLRESFFADTATATAEAERLIGLYTYGRAMYDVVVKNALLSVHIGQTVRITYHRWDLESGKNFVVVGVADDADLIETTLTLFG